MKSFKTLDPTDCRSLFKYVLIDFHEVLCELLIWVVEVFLFSFETGSH